MRCVQLKFSEVRWWIPVISFNECSFQLLNLFRDFSSLLFVKPADTYQVNHLLFFLLFMLFWLLFCCWFLLFNWLLLCSFWFLSLDFLFCGLFFWHSFLFYLFLCGCNFGLNFGCLLRLIFLLNLQWIHIFFNFLLVLLLLLPLSLFFLLSLLLQLFVVNRLNRDDNWGHFRWDFSSLFGDSVHFFFFFKFWLLFVIFRDEWV